jgi:hypothetical protein
MAEPGEYIINRPAVTRYGPSVFEAINRQQIELLTGGPVPGFQQGGQVPAPHTIMMPQASAAAKTSQANQITVKGDIVINVPESAAPQRPEDWRYVTREFILPEIKKAGHA